MQKFAGFVTTYKKTIIIAFILFALVSGLLTALVTVNYNMVDYLPQDAQSTRAITIMKDEFGGDTPNMRVMVSDVSLLDAMEYKSSLVSIEGVLSVSWLDDVIGKDVLTTTPIEYLDPAIVATFYQDGKALFSLTIESGEETTALSKIYALIGEDNAAAGDAVNAAALQEMAVSEVLGAMVILVPVILIILILTTTSWFEPLLFLITIGVAVLMNIGTMAFWSDISYITQTVSPILQLAVSLDYAIFLLHSFGEYRQSYEPREAMRLAIRRAVSTVSASAATTVIGFFALLFMRFGIGSDLGVHLAKGVAISFLSVMIFLPALTLATYKLIDRTKHKRFLPQLGSIGKGLLKSRLVFMVIAFILVVPCFLAQSNTEYMYGMGSIAGSTRAGKDAAKIETEFGKENLLVLLVPKGDLGKEAELCDELSKIPQINQAVSFVNAAGVGIPDQYVPNEVTAQFYSPNYARIILYTELQEEGEQTFEAVERINQITKRYYGQYYLTGQSATLYDMKNIVESDIQLVNLVAIAGIFLVILLTFRSLTLPLLLVFTIETAIWINLSFAYFSDSALSFIGYLIISTVQLGATVDYAILLSNHYLNERKQHTKSEAMRKSLSDTLPALLVSAGILATAGFTLAATSGNPIIAELGLLLGRGTLLSLGMVVLVLPALLLLFDKIIGKTTIKSGFIK